MVSAYLTKKTWCNVTYVYQLKEKGKASSLILSNACGFERFELTQSRTGLDAVK